MLTADHKTLDAVWLFLLFGQYFTNLQSLLGDLGVSVATKKITYDQFQEDFESTLGDYHAKVSGLGRELGGNTDPADALNRLPQDYYEAGMKAEGAAIMHGHDLFDTAMAEHALRIEQPFLFQFIYDIKAGRYDKDAQGTVDIDAVVRRAKMYAGKLRMTANDAWLLVLPDDTPIYWNLGKDDNCPVCPVWADASPYTLATLPSVPGACETPCMMNCGCWLNAGGQTGFKRPDEIEKEATE